VTDIYIHTRGRAPLDEGSARRRGVYLHNTQHSQEKNIHATDGIRTRSPMKRAAADLCLRPSGLLDRRCGKYEGIFVFDFL